MIRLFGLATLGALAACGLLSNDITLVRLHLPAKSFSIDTADWRLPPSSTVPMVPCSAGCGSLCTGGACTGTCNQASGNCEADVPVSLKNDYNLAAEAPDYQTFASLNVVSVTVDDIYFDISSNTLNVDTPELEVVMGPPTVNSPDDPAAELVGTIPAVRAGQTGRVDLVFAPNGQAVLKKYMDNFKTPFRVLVGGDVTVTGGQQTPAGKLVGAVQADAHASLGG
jgi:hypothetical protein